MMMLPLNVLTFLLVKSTISPSLARAMTTLSGRKTTKRVRVWAGDTYWRMTDRWGLRGGVQYDTRLDNIANSSAASIVVMKIAWFS
jgi:lipopolysaccharide assembly outer membrane protein LptD (OstA)